MANMTDATELEFLDGITGVSSLFSATMSMCLLTADPTEAGLVTNEYTLNGCTRLLLSAKYSAASGGTSANTATITFPTATADWTPITHLGFMEADVESVADMKAWVALDSPITILNGQVFEFAIGDQTLTAD